VLALDVPGYGDSWLVQISGQRGALAITQAVRYSHTGYLVYDDVLPIRVEGGTRYLTSTRVQQLTVAGKPVQIRDGLSDPVEIAPCAPIEVTAQRIATQTLPATSATYRLIDLGRGIAAPHYPLLTDPWATGAGALASLDTCQLTSPNGLFGSAGKTSGPRSRRPLTPAWPVGDLRMRAQGLKIPGHPGELAILDWQASSGVMSAALWSAPGNVVALSAVDPGQPLQIFTITMGTDSLIVLAWNPEGKAGLQVPMSATPLLSMPGVMVLAKPDQRAEFALMSYGTSIPYRRVIN
jgi:hypothetical protein